MGHDVDVSCRCGDVHGRVRDASPHTVNRVVCYCDDCQAFLHHLGRADLLDAKGGTDIVQVAPASLMFDRGTDRIAGLRLTPKGVYRWYASCCKTPLGNTVTPAIPFVGIAHGAFGSDRARRDEVFGAPRGSFFGKYAVGEPPAGSKSLNLGVIAGMLRRFAGWKLGGATWPHPFFERSTGAPRYPVTTLPIGEREALRALCGPHPTARAAAQ
jgi:hypothetical protein